MAFAVTGETGKKAASGIDELRGVPLREEDIDGFRSALAAAGLPTDDVAAEDVRAFRFSLGGRPVGYGALEAYGSDVLLRSLVVAPEARGEGIGGQVVDWLLGQARSLDAERAFLLTTDARGYFERLGFEVIERTRAPQTILATRQAAGLCPASATLLTRSMAR